MSKHTPGPWDFWSGYNPFDKIEAQVTAEGGDIVIASYNSLIAEGEANAQLMAASPKLLVALQDCVSVMERELAGLRVIQPELNQARAAIAEALGEP